MAWPAEVTAGCSTLLPQHFGHASRVTRDVTAKDRLVCQAVLSSSPGAPASRGGGVLVLVGVVRNAALLNFVLRPRTLGDFPGSPVVKTQHFQCRGCRFDPWSGN